MVPVGVGVIDVPVVEVVICGVDVSSDTVVLPEVVAPVEVGGVLSHGPLVVP